MLYFTFRPCVAKAMAKKLGRSHPLFKRFFICLFLISLALILALIVLVWPQENLQEVGKTQYQPQQIPVGPSVTIMESSPVAEERNELCTFHKCFNVYECGYNDQTQISIYVYPLQQVRKT